MRGRFNTGGSGIRLIVIAVAIGLILGGIVMVFTDVRVDRRTGALFDDDLFVEDSDASGRVWIETVLKDRNGDIVRRTDPYETIAANLLDPVSDEEVKTYEAKVSWKTTGRNIDWTTISVSGNLIYDEYVGINNEFVAWPDDKNVDLGAKSGSSQNGEFVFSVDLDALMPDKIHFVGPTIRGETMVFDWDQKTSQAHAVVFKLKGSFSIEVLDDWGNPYNSEYEVYIELRLVWSGSDFNVEWGTGATSTTTSETTTETQTDETPSPKSTPPVEIESSTNMLDLESDEFVALTTKTDTFAAASLFGGTSQEDMGIVLVGVGFVIFALSLLMPALPNRHRR